MKGKGEMVVHLHSGIVKLAAHPEIQSVGLVAVPSVIVIDIEAVGMPIGHGSARAAPVHRNPGPDSIGRTVFDAAPDTLIHGRGQCLHR